MSRVFPELGTDNQGFPILILFSQLWRWLTQHTLYETTLGASIFLQLFAAQSYLPPAQKVGRQLLHTASQLNDHIWYDENKLFMLATVLFEVYG